MKTLMIGMDGVQIETFTRGWTPYISSLIEKGQKLSLKEDLVSRGWVEILTGQHAIKTGALYDRPALKGTHEWSTKFKIDDIPDLGKEVKPFWQVLNERGVRVGIMNVPTTSPAPKVDGFFVSGGGGGSAVTQDVPLVQCYPKEVKAVLDDLGYISDERPQSLFGEKKLYNPGDLFARIEKMVQKRTEAFVKLSEKYQIDFGFLVYKSSTAMAEILCLPELQRQNRGSKDENKELLAAVKHFYQFLDKQVRVLVESTSCQDIVFVSDHGTTVINRNVNINKFLLDQGYQYSSSKGKGLYKLVHLVKRLTPVSLRAKLGKVSTVRKAYVGVKPFDANRSKAFCMVMGDWVHGVFINDQKRFGGPVLPEDIKALSLEIVEKFNSEPLAVQHGLTAHIKPEEQTVVADYFPDVYFTMPEGYLINNVSSTFISNRELPPGPCDLESIIKGPPLTAKSSVPLAVAVNSEWSLSNQKDKNLQCIYDHVLKCFQ